MIISIPLGSVCIASWEFRNPTTNALTDPASVLFKYRVDDGTYTIYTYGTDVALVKDAVGQYHVNIDCSLLGLYTCRAYATGVGQSADLGQFQVV